MKNKELFNEKMKLIGSLILRIILYYIIAVLFYIVVLDNLLGNFLGNTLYRFNYNLYEWCVYNKESIFLFYMIIILVIALYRFFSKKVDNIEKLYKSFDNILNEETQNIELPNEMTRFSEKLNKIKYEYILSTKRAKEAEQKKNDLIMYMAHDLKTPLTSVIGYLSLLNEEQEISKKLQNKYIKIALDKALRVEELTNQFFEITRYNLNDIPLNKTNIDLVMLLDQLVEEFYPMLEERNLKLNITKPNILMYNADGDKLARAFGNLLKNAINYSYENTTITINMIENEENIIDEDLKNREDTIIALLLDANQKIFQKIKEKINIEPYVLYTTRPIRTGEKDGIDYNFLSNEKMNYNLKEEKLVKYETYGIIELTEQGENLAQKILEAYDIVYLFLKDVLDLDEQSAKEEAEKIKLVTTDETINKLAKYVHNVLGLKELNCNYDINQEKCRCCVKRAKTKKSNDMQN